jgi:Nitroreductase family
MATRREVNVGMVSAVAAAATATAASSQAFAQAAQAIELPPPVMSGGKSLMEALQVRQSMREYSDRALPNQILSNLLWAAWGVNRPKTDGRTAPHWHNAYAMDIYLAMADGVWLYEPKGQRLVLHMPGDLRAQTTTGQPFVAAAPLNLVYAFDMSKLTPATDKEKAIAAAACAAVVAQNVYLYCASEGLATVLRQSVPGETLAEALKLPPGQVIQFAQTVGYAKA